MYIDDNTFEFIRADQIKAGEFIESLRAIWEKRLRLVAALRTVNEDERARFFDTTEKLIADRLAALEGANPNDTSLPMITGWWFAKRPSEEFITCCGDVTNHQLLPDGPVNTSPIFCWDKERCLIATQNTIYRLGKMLDIIGALSNAPKRP
jgi:hypothetical protein